MARYHVASYSSLLKDYDRNPVHITEAAKSASTKKPPPKKCFENKDVSECSMIEELPTLGDGSYASPSPQSWKLVGLAWACVDILNGDLALLKKVWLSLLCPTGCITQDRDFVGDSGGLVFGATAYGVLVWRLDRRKVGASSCTRRARRTSARCPRLRGI